MLSQLINKYLSFCYRDIDKFITHPIQTQDRVLKYLLKNGADTYFGQKYNFSEITLPGQYEKLVPISRYEDLRPYLDLIIHQRQKKVLWNKPVKWFAMSSGTTEDRSKYIPVTEESLFDGHYKCGRHMLSIYAKHHPCSSFLLGKTLIIGGSKQYNTIGNSVYTADISAILIKNIQWWAKYSRTPEDIALMDNWDKKIEALTTYAIKHDIRALMGVPSWLLVLLQNIYRQTGVTLKELWPRLEVFFHGGVRFEPYLTHYNEIIGYPQMEYWETYNASEGFFGVQYSPANKDLLLMLDNGIYYEFIPQGYWHLPHPPTLPLSEVTPHQNYAVVISSNGGLWRYMLGDTIKFTSTHPYLFRITGRVKSFINAFGEELIIDNAEKALAHACSQTNASINEYTVAPIYQTNHSGTGGRHQWVIEFKRLPDSMRQFTECLDTQLKAQNSDYAAKRQNNLTLQAPIVEIAPAGTFEEWLRRVGKLGGQNKVPRLVNDRGIIEQILSLISKKNLNN